MPKPPIIHFKADEDALLNECKRIGATGISVFNRGRANFATTYSTDFCELVADLLLLYRKCAVADPVSRLLEEFRSRHIESCRGAEMTGALLDYMLTYHVSKLGKTDRYRVLRRLVGKNCPVCGKWKRGLAEHVAAVHKSDIQSKATADAA